MIENLINTLLTALVVFAAVGYYYSERVARMKSSLANAGFECYFCPRAVQVTFHFQSVLRPRKGFPQELIRVKRLEYLKLRTKDDVVVEVPVNYGDKVCVKDDHWYPTDTMILIRSGMTKEKLLDMAVNAEMAETEMEEFVLPDE